MPRKEWYQANAEKCKSERRDYHRRNAQKENAKNYERWKINEDRYIKTRKAWMEKNRDLVASYGLEYRRRQNGFQRGLFEERFREQSGLCAICGVLLTTKGRSWTSAAGDHCHATNKARGILCKGCNLLLGQANDSVERLRRAIDYLTKWSDPASRDAG